MRSEYIRNIVFGTEDGLVSTVGSLTGIAASTQDPRFIIIAGLIVVTVESFSMGVGSYLSEETEHQIDTTHKDNIIFDGLFMFMSYFLAGIIVLTPYILFDGQTAVITSVTAALIGLFLLGFIKGRVVGQNPLRHGLKMLIIAGFAVLIGLAVGLIGRNYLGVSV